MRSLSEQIEAICVQTEDGQTGKPVVLMDWQKEFLAGMEGKRVVWLEIPRKNGKSFLLACIAIVKFIEGFMRNENPQIVLAAATREQAKILYSYIRNQVLFNPVLQKFIKPYLSELRLVGKPGTLKTIAADGPSNHGLNPSLILCDELHAWSETKGASLWEALRTSMGARDSQLIAITTAGSAHTFSHGLHLYARQVVNKEIQDPSWYPVIYGCDDTDDPQDPKVWAKANPSFGVTIKKKYFEEFAIRMKHDTLALHSFRKLHLNQWAGSSEGFIDTVAWSKCEGKKPRGMQGPIIGIDFGSTNDFTAFVLLWFDDHGNTYTSQYYQITQGGWNKRRNKYPSMLKQWEKEGFLDVCQSDVARTDDRHRMLNKLFDEHEVLAVCYDPYLAHHGAIQPFIDHHGENMFYSVQQGRKHLSEPTKMLYKDVYSGKLKHDRNTITTWMIGNAVVKQDEDGNLKLDKEKASEKIDGPAALVNAYAYYLHYLDKVSQYDDEGILFL